MDCNNHQEKTDCLKAFSFVWGGIQEIKNLCTWRGFFVRIQVTSQNRFAVKIQVEQQYGSSFVKIREENDDHQKQTNLEPINSSKEGLWMLTVPSHISRHQRDSERLSAERIRV